MTFQRQNRPSIRPNKRRTIGNNNNKKKGAHQQRFIGARFIQQQLLNAVELLLLDLVGLGGGGVSG